MCLCVKPQAALLEMMMANEIKDEPTDNTGLNWEQEVRDLVRLETICNRQAAADKVRFKRTTILTTKEHILKLIRVKNWTLFTTSSLISSKTPPPRMNPSTPPAHTQPRATPPCCSASSAMEPRQRPFFSALLCLSVFVTIITTQHLQQLLNQ